MRNGLFTSAAVPARLDGQSAAIRASVEKRGITSVLHFTRLENLRSILSLGLLTRDKLHLCPGAAINDLERYDGTNAVCASIGFPNYRMFYRLRCNDRGAEWIVLKLNPSVLWEARCAFCATNAANAVISRIPIEQRRGLRAFETLFEDYVGKSRRSLSIPDSYPTNPQAEVLLLDGAEISYVDAIYFQTWRAMHEFRTLQEKHPNFAKFDTFLNGGYFDPRDDYAHWK